MNTLPLVSGRALHDILAWRPQGPVSVARYCADALALAAALPAGRFVVNLCEDRYHYAVLLAACAISGRVSLQPSSQSEATLRQLAQDYAGALAVTDAPTPLPPVLPDHASHRPLPALRAFKLLPAPPFVGPPKPRLPIAPPTTVCTMGCSTRVLNSRSRYCAASLPPPMM